MKKNSNRLIALLFITISCNTHTMKRLRENENKPTQSFDFANLPPEIRYHMVLLLGAGSTAQSIKEAGQAINALAQTNKELNELINDPKICLTIIKNLSKQFVCSDQEAAEALQTQEAKRRLEIQRLFLDVCETKEFELNEKKLNLLYEKYKAYVDLNFIYHYLDDEDLEFYDMTLLMIAAKNDDCFVIKNLLKLGADINKTTSYGTTALMAANSYVHNIPETTQCLLQYPNVAINQQNRLGETALMLAMYGKNKLNIQLLLDAGADPELATYKGRTLLQSTDNQEIFNLILEAIHKKHEKQGKSHGFYKK